ncbi:hypothetical protein Tco_0660069 [Tanacetum coccineum]
MGLLHAQLKIRPIGGVEVGADIEVAAEDTWVSGWKVGQRLQTKQDGLESNRNNLGKVSLRGPPPSHDEWLRVKYPPDAVRRGDGRAEYLAGVSGGVSSRGTNIP